MMSMMQSANVDPAWKELYKEGGGCLIIIGVLLFAAFGNFAVGGSEPTDPLVDVKTYATSNTNLLSSVILTAAFILFIPGILGLYAALKQANRAYAVIASGFVLGGIATFLTEAISHIATIQLSQSYATANVAQQASLLAAAEATIAFAGAAGLLGTIVISLGILLLGVTMLKGVFGKGPAYFSILLGVLGLVGSLPAASGLFIAYFILYAVWLLWVGFKLYRLG